MTGCGAIHVIMSSVSRGRRVNHHPESGNLPASLPWATASGDYGATNGVADDTGEGTVTGMGGEIRAGDRVLVDDRPGWCWAPREQ